MQAETGRPLSVFHKMYHVQNNVHQSGADGLGLGLGEEEGDATAPPGGASKAAVFAANAQARRA